MIEHILKSSKTGDLTDEPVIGFMPPRRLLMVDGCDRWVELYLDDHPDQPAFSYRVLGRVRPSEELSHNDDNDAVHDVGADGEEGCGYLESTAVSRGKFEIELTLGDPSCRSFAKLAGVICARNQSLFLRVNEPDGSVAELVLPWKLVSAPRRRTEWYPNWSLFRVYDGDSYPDGWGPMHMFSPRSEFPRPRPYRAVAPLEPPAGVVVSIC